MPRGFTSGRVIAAKRSSAPRSFKTWMKTISGITIAEIWATPTAADCSAPNAISAQPEGSGPLPEPRP
jgi:hypothetical protein